MTIMQPERRLVNSIRAYLEGKDAWVFKVHGGDNPFQESGVPDLLVCWRGRFIGLEVKQPGKKPTPRQEHVLREVRRAGGVVEVVSSVEQVEKLLKRTSRKRG
jgi:hypothetical protein